MNKLTGKTKGLLVLVSAMEVLVIVIGALATYQGARVLQFAQQGEWHRAAATLALCLGLLGANALASIGNAALTQKLYSCGILHLRSSIMKSIFARPVYQFREKDEAYYLNLLTNDISAFTTEFLGTIPLLVSWTARIVAAAAMLWVLHPALMAVSLAASALLLAAQKVFNNLATKAQNELSQASEDFTAVMKETVQGYEAIRMDAGLPDMLRRFESSSAGERRKRSRARLVGALAQEFFLTSASLVYLAGLGVGGWLIAAGKLDAVLMLAGVNYIVQMSNGFGNVIEYSISIRSIRDIRKKLGRESKPWPETSQKVTGRGLHYRDISFGFGEKKLYDHLSCDFAPGNCYALIGQSGSGKSTLTRLGLKYYDGYQGTITLGDRDIRELPDKSVYERIGVLPQKPFLFNGSLYENITLFSGKPSRDSAEYAALLEKVNLTDLAERVGERPLGDFGGSISGGEGQRICLARCFRQKKPIYIFDEPTTGLDPENVSIIQNAIFGEEGTTRIVISHDQGKEHLRRFDGVVAL